MISYVRDNVNSQVNDLSPIKTCNNQYKPRVNGINVNDKLMEKLIKKLLSYEGIYL
jgi:hypothetical protein